MRRSYSLPLHVKSQGLSPERTQDWETNHGQHGPFYAVGNSVGERSREARATPGDSGESVSLTVSPCQQGFLRGSVSRGAHYCCLQRTAAISAIVMGFVASL